MIAVADNGSDVEPWFTILVLAVAVVVWVVLSLRTIRREGLSQSRPRPIEPLAPVQPFALSLCSTIGCPRKPTRNPHGWLLCDECPPTTTTKEIR